ncbi:hypothetical protein SUGI_1227930 [Cryptomeria japonica]|uniref:Uncharacterized protein n=1 Tax=Cryptomeria japonica TaxID=3369 RepID=A0AAD3NP47_CRYJA|nr:hypothetical protein SUGI_1227930 [Cryptomeria japonica]
MNRYKKYRSLLERLTDSIRNTPTILGPRPSLWGHEPAIRRILKGRIVGAGGSPYYLKRFRVGGRYSWRVAILLAGWGGILGGVGGRKIGGPTRGPYSSIGGMVGSWERCPRGNRKGGRS